MPDKNEHIGMLWKRTGSTSRKEFLAGHIWCNEVKVEIVAFPTTNRSGEGDDPAYRIFPARPRPRADYE
jgi:hypothetical protein